METPVNEKKCYVLVCAVAVAARFARRLLRVNYYLARIFTQGEREYVWYVRFTAMLFIKRLRSPVAS